MGRYRVLGMTLLLASLAAAVQAAERPLITPSPFDGSQNAAFRRWGGVSVNRPKAPPPPATPAAKTQAIDTAAAVRAQEEANFLRRLAVCDRLRQLALETGDETLERKADALQEKSETVYKKRTADASTSASRSDTDQSRGAKR